MTTYLYSGVDDAGRTIRGTMAAESEEMLEESLRKTGIWLLKAEQDKAAPIDKLRSSTKLSGGGRRRQLINFCTMMSFLSKVGVPMVQALEITAQDCENEAFRGLVFGIKRDVEAGAKLHETLENHPGVFPAQFTSLIKAGEESGSLPEAFIELKRYLEWQEQIISDVRQATIYPAIVLIMVILFVIVLFSFVVPKFVSLLAVAKVALPLPTVIVFGVSDFMKATWWIWLSLITVLPAILTLGCKFSVRFAIACDWVKFRLPLLGPLQHMLVMSRFAHNLAVLYRAGINILNAVTLCQDLVGSKLVGEALRDIHQRVEQGNALSDSMRRHPVFPQLLIRMVVMGERTGSLDKALDNVADYYNLVIPRRIKKLFGVLEPALILTLVGIVGFVALAIFMPILSLMEALR